VNWSGDATRPHPEPPPTSAPVNTAWDSISAEIFPHPSTETVEQNETLLLDEVRICTQGFRSGSVLDPNGFHRVAGFGYEV